MARYIDADRLIKTIFPFDCVDKKHYSINAQAVFDAIKNAPTANIATKSELDQLQNKYNLAVAEREANVHGFMECLMTLRKDVAKEIFAEIEEAIERIAFASCWSEGGFKCTIAELKKKYIGE